MSEASADPLDYLAAAEREIIRLRERSPSWTSADPDAIATALALLGIGYELRRIADRLDGSFSLE